MAVNNLKVSNKLNTHGRPKATLRYICNPLVFSCLAFIGASGSRVSAIPNPAKSPNVAGNPKSFFGLSLVARLLFT